MTYFEDQRYGPRVPENKLNETAATDLQNFEARAGGFRRWEVEVGQVKIPGQFDADHFKQLHAHVMKDVYPWAGETRTEQNVDRQRVHQHNPTMYEDRVHYAPAPLVDSRLDEISEQLKRTNGLRGLDQPQFVAQIANVFDQYNHVQPFRAGNEQTIMTAVTLIGQEAGYKIDFDKVRGDELRKAGDTALARPAEAQHQVPLLGLQNVLSRITEPAPGREAELLRSPELAQVAGPTLLDTQRSTQRDFQQAGQRLGEEFGFQEVLNNNGREKALAVAKAQYEVERGGSLEDNLPVLRDMADTLERSGKVSPGEIQQYRTSMDKLQELEKPVQQEQARSDFARFAPEVGVLLRAEGQEKDAQALEKLEKVVRGGGLLTGKDAESFEFVIGKANLLVPDQGPIGRLEKAGDQLIDYGKLVPAPERGNELGSKGPEREIERY
jgi:cell filamentation protein